MRKQTVNSLTELPFTLGVYFYVVRRTGAPSTKSRVLQQQTNRFTFTRSNPWQQHEAVTSERNNRLTRHITNVSFLTRAKETLNGPWLEVIVLNRFRQHAVNTLHNP